jgi:hypothetical protein
MKLQKNGIGFTAGIYCDKMSTGVGIGNQQMKDSEVPIASMLCCVQFYFQS